MSSKNTIRRIVEFVGRMEGIDPQALRDGLEVLYLHRQIEQLAENDLSRWGVAARQFEIMESLYHNPEGTMTPAALADEVGLTRSAMTSALDGLAVLGHTLRTHHPTDRRMVVVCLTSAGRAFMHERLPERYRELHQIVAGLSARERTMLLQTSKRVLDLQTHLLAGMVPASAATGQPAHAGKDDPLSSNATH